MTFHLTITCEMENCRKVYGAMFDSEVLNNIINHPKEVAERGLPAMKDFAALAAFEIMAEIAKSLDLEN